MSVEEHFRRAFEEFGLDMTDENLVDTPRRMAEMWKELFYGYGKEPEIKLTTFDSEKYRDMVICRDIPVSSMCSHHMLPFTGVCHIAYIPKDRIVGLSKIPRIVDHFSHRPQNQERLVAEIADFMMEKLSPQGVLVTMQAEHMCYDEKTEILTENGWSLFSDLKKLDRVMQVDPKTCEGSWVLPTDYVSYPFKGMMMKFESSSLDIMVTPEHRMLYKFENQFWKHDFEGWEICTAADVYSWGNLYIPQSIRWSNESPKAFEVGRYLVDFDSWVVLMAIWISKKEGRFEIAGSKVRIMQNSGDDFDELCDILDKMPFRYSCQDDKGEDSSIVFDDVYLSEFFREFWYEDSRRHIPKWIKEASSSTLEKFLRWYMVGSEDVPVPFGNHYGSKSSVLIDDMQEIMLKVGRVGTKSVSGVYYRIGERKVKSGEYKWYGKIYQHHKSMVPYDGMVYCVTVPNSAVVVRRCGRVAVSGNCVSMRGVKKPGTKMITTAIRGDIDKSEVLESLRIMGGS